MITIFDIATSGLGLSPEKLKEILVNFYSVISPNNSRKEIIVALDDVLEIRKAYLRLLNELKGRHPIVIDVMVDNIILNKDQDFAINSALEYLHKTRKEDNNIAFPYNQTHLAGFQLPESDLAEIVSAFNPDNSNPYHVLGKLLLSVDINTSPVALAKINNNNQAYIATLLFLSIFQSLK